MIVADVVKNGTVIAVENDKIMVEIGCAADECQGCKAAMFCRTGDDILRLSVKRPADREISVGDRVILNGRLRNWFSGWLILAVLPCVAIFVGIGVAMILSWSDVAAGGLCLGLLVLYYLLLYLFRGKIDRKVEWEIVTRERTPEGSQ